jgi:hypothetical protein
LSAIVFKEYLAQGVERTGKLIAGSTKWKCG